MSRLKINILANFIGNGWIGLVALVLVPFYIKFMGIEAYGLVGIFTTLQTLFSLMDLGLSTTLNRELAHLSTHPGNQQEMRNLLRTFEVVFWIITLVIIGLFVFLSPWIGESWVKPQSLSIPSVQQALLMMGLAIAFQFPFTLYSGGLMGLQRQILCNGLAVFYATIRGGGALLILWLYSPTIQAFFIWQLVVSISQTFLGALFLWSSLPKTKFSPKFERISLNRIWRFAIGTSGTNILSVILTQSDKIILSKMVSLKAFGYYSLAMVLASSLNLIINPIFGAIFPRFSQLLAQGNSKDLIITYRHAFQLMIVSVLPLAVVIGFFAPELLYLWTHDPLVVENAQILTRLLTFAYFFYALIAVPYALQLAYGWAKMSFYQTLAAVLMTLPFMFIGIRYYGSIGAAISWIIWTMGYIFIWLPYMNKRFFNSWNACLAIDKILFTILGALSVGLIGYWWYPKSGSIYLEIPWVMLTFFLVFAISAWTTPFMREWVKASVFRKIRPNLT